MADGESFADRLKAYRKIMGWTQEELADKWSYSSETISAWERGKRNPNTQQIPRIANFLGISPQELIQSLDLTRGKATTQENAEAAFAGQQEALLSALETWGEVQHIYRSRTEFSRDFSYPRMLEEAHSLLAVGISLNAIAMNYSREKIIRSIVEKKSTYELCFLNPEGVYCAMREREETYSRGQIAELTRLNIANMQTISEHIGLLEPDCTKQLRLMTYDLPARFNIYVVNDTLMTVQFYAYERGEDTPTFLFRRQSRSGLFDFYASAAKHVLKQAKPIET